MSWKDKGRESAANFRALEVERQKVRENGDLLKAELAELSTLSKQVHEVVQEALQMMIALDSPSEGARVECATATKEIAQIGKQISDLKQNQDDQLHQVTLKIVATSDFRYAKKLALMSQMNEILRSKLENDMPRCRDLASLREQTAFRMRDLVEKESRDRNP